jgi:hypothetical protein
MATNTKKVGDGITARTIRLKDVEDFSLDEWADLKSTLVSLPEVYQSAWGPNAPLIANIREWLVEVRSKAPEPSDHRALAEYFAYRETEAWFVLTIAKFARHIERCVEQKKSWEAVSFALDLGMLVAELAYLEAPRCLRHKVSLPRHDVSSPPKSGSHSLSRRKRWEKVSDKHSRSLPSTSA